MWTRLECDAPGAVIPAGASALSTSTGQAYEDSASSSYSYNEAPDTFGDAGSGDAASSEDGASEEATNMSGPIILIAVGAAVLAASAIVCAVVRCRVRCRLRKAAQSANDKSTPTFAGWSAGSAVP